MTVEAHWANRWFLYLAARPVCVVDGQPRVITWGEPVRIGVEPGAHRISAGIRYRGFTRVLGREPVDVHLMADETLPLTARNGPLNNDPFRISAAVLEGAE